MVKWIQETEKFIVSSLYIKDLFKKKINVHIYILAFENWKKWIYFHGIPISKHSKKAATAIKIIKFIDTFLVTD